MKIHKDQSGFTMIELMIVVMVVAIVSLGLAAFMIQQVQNQRQMDFIRQGEDVANTALRAASQQDSVIATGALEFQAIPGPPATPAAGYWDPNNQYSP